MAKKTRKKKFPKAKTGAYLLQVDPEEFMYKNLPNAATGMYMDPGPRMPNLAKSLEELYPPGEFSSNIDRGVRQIQGPMPIGTPPNTSNVEPGKPLDLNPSKIKPQQPKKGGGYNAGNVALAAMTAFDAFLPNPVPKQQVVQPQMAYNPNPYGLGSQALMEDGGAVPALFNFMDTFYGELGNAADTAVSMLTGGGGGGLSSILGMEHGGKIEKAKDGKWIQKAINPKHKGYCTPMTKSTCTPKRKALAKTLKKMAKNRKKDYGGIIPDSMSNFNPHEYEHGGDVNGCAKLKEVGSKYPNTDLLEQWLLYPTGGPVKPGRPAKPAPPPASGRAPIIVNNPNDPRLKNYTDSLDLYNLYKIQEKKFGNQGNVDASWLNEEAPEGQDTGEWNRTFQKRLRPKGYSVLAAAFGNNPIKKGEILAYERKTGQPVMNDPDNQATREDIEFMSQNNNPNIYFPSRKSADIYHKTIKPTGYYYEGRGPINYKYARPVQPIEYQPLAQTAPVNSISPVVKKPVEAPYVDIDPDLSPSIVNRSRFQASIPEPEYSSYNYDPRTNYSVTFPEGNNQKTTYFPSQDSWDSFVNNNSGLLIDSQQRLGRSSATLKNRPMEYGGKIRKVGAMYPNTDLFEQLLVCKNGGMAVAGDVLASGPDDPKLSAQERYYQSSAKLSYYKDLLNQKLKAKNPKAYTDYFKGLLDLRRTGNATGANKYVQDSQYNEYLTPQEVQSLLGQKYNDYLESIKNVNAYNVSQGQQPLYGTVEGESDLNNLNYGRRFASLQITPSYSAYNRDKGTRYERQYTYNPESGEVNYTESGDVKLRPDYLSLSKPSSGNAFRHGGVMYNDGGEVETMWGGNAELESYNPYDGGTIEFNGASHDQGGIGMSYNGNPVEVEGGEYASRDMEGNLNIFGNMYIPGSKTKFKQAAKGIASKEKRYNMLKDKGSKLVNDSNPANKFEQLAFNAGKVMMQGGEMGQKDLASKKEQLASLQKAMLNMAEFHGLDPFEMSKGKMKKAKKGASIPSYQDGGGNDPTRADRNMNPGNIKYGKFAKKYGAKRDKDGFAIFPSRAVGERAMKDLLTGENYKNLSVSQAIKKWTDGHPYRYDLGPLTDKTVKELDEDELSIVLGTMTKGEGTRYGLTPRPSPTVPSTPLGTPTFTPYSLPDIPVSNPKIPTTPSSIVPVYDTLEVPEERKIPSNVEPLHINQLLGEMYAIATNKVEPVPAQRYEPQLYTPYQVSFQDRINANQSAFNAQMRAVGPGNPAALGTLAAQKYAADQAVYADEFRTNQAIANDITNKNIALVNDANLKNLGMADTQMVRQSQARSRTRELNQMILNSISGKYAQNELENKRLAAYENLYDYRFVPQEDGGQSATYFGPNAMFNYDGKSAQSNFANPSRTITRYDAYGNVKGYAEYDDSELRDQQKLIDLEMKRRKLPLLGAPPLNSK